MATIKHISDGINTWDLPSGEAFKLPVSATIAQLAAGGTFTISGVTTDSLRNAITNKQTIVISYTGMDGSSGEVLLTNIGLNNGGGFNITSGTAVFVESTTPHFCKATINGNNTNVTTIILSDVMPGTPSLTLADLTNVDAFFAQNGDIIVYDANTSTWVAQQPGGGGGSQLPVIIDIGRIVHSSGIPQPTIADVPQGNYTIPFDRQVMFSYRAYESGFYSMYWTNMPDAYKIGEIDQYGSIRGNAEDLHWIVQDMINNQQLPLTQDVEYRLVMYKVLSGQTYCIEIPLWITTSTTATHIDFYLDSSGFNVRQVSHIGADS